MSIDQDVQQLAPGDLVELYEIDATSLGGSIVRLHAGVNGLGDDVVWQGNTYSRFPIIATGFQKSGSGAMPRPVVQVANVTGLVGVLARTYNDLVGARFTRRRTFAKYLDAVNFAAGNPSADPTAHFADEVWIVDRKSTETRVMVEFELAAAWDVAGIMLPRRQVVQNVCTWGYRSSECGYTGGAVAAINDQPTTDPLLDQCGKRLASCKLRFGEYAELPYGGFPAAGLIR